MSDEPYTFWSPEYHKYELKHDIGKYGKTEVDRNLDHINRKWIQCECGAHWPLPTVVHKVK